MKLGKTLNRRQQGPGFTGRRAGFPLCPSGTRNGTFTFWRDRANLLGGPKPLRAGYQDSGDIEKNTNAPCLKIMSCSTDLKVFANNTVKRLVGFFFKKNIIARRLPSSSTEALGGFQRPSRASRRRVPSPKAWRCNAPFYPAELTGSPGAVFRPAPFKAQRQERLALLPLGAGPTCTSGHYCWPGMGRKEGNNPCASPKQLIRAGLVGTSGGGQPGSHPLHPSQQADTRHFRRRTPGEVLSAEGGPRTEAAASGMGLWPQHGKFSLCSRPTPLPFRFPLFPYVLKAH